MQESDNNQFRNPWEDPAAAPFIRIDGLRKEFDGFPAVDGVSLNIYKGELFAILGRFRLRQVHFAADVGRF